VLSQNKAVLKNALAYFRRGGEKKALRDRHLDEADVLHVLLPVGQPVADPSSHDASFAALRHLLNLFC